MKILRDKKTTIDMYYSSKISTPNAFYLKEVLEKRFKEEGRGFSKSCIAPEMCSSNDIVDEVPYVHIAIKQVRESAPRYSMGPPDLYYFYKWSVVFECTGYYPDEFNEEIRMVEQVLQNKIKDE